MRKRILFLACLVMIVALGAVWANDAFSSGCTMNCLPNLASNTCYKTVCSCVPQPSCLFNDCLKNYNINTKCASNFEQCTTVSYPCEYE